MGAKQVHIIHIDPELARRARHSIATSGAYDDLSEFVEVALSNQLAVEPPLNAAPDASRPARDHGNDRPKERRSVRGRESARTDAVGPRENLLRRPDAPPRTATAPDQPSVALFSMTNRLFPIKVALRVLAVLADATPEAISVSAFQEAAAHTARALGLRLRAEDAEARRRGTDRRWIALPVGDDETAATGRFIHHFTITSDNSGRLFGPLADLGLATVDSTRGLLLTPAGASVALAPSPVLDQAGDGAALLGDEERALFIAAINANDGELVSVREFVHVVNDKHGKQSAVDETLAELHSGWSSAQAVAHRAAMLGRLRDLGLAEVEGRGGDGLIRLDPQIDDYWEG